LYFSFSLGELITEGKTGMLFKDSTQLAKLLEDWLFEYPHNIRLQERSKQFRDNIKSWCDLRWDQNWKTSAAPIFTYDD
jgi:hypothetical protein